MMEFSNEDLILSAYEAKIPSGKYRPALHSRIPGEPQRQLDLLIQRAETGGGMGEWTGRVGVFGRDVLGQVDGNCLTGGLLG